MIQKLQKLFHTDKWWGKALFVACFYLVFLFIGYWLWFLVFYLNLFNFNIFTTENILPSVYFFLILPILSFIFLFKLNYKINLKINKTFLFFINLIIILLNLFLFLLLGVYFFLRPNFF
ncbi:TPA: hypothetical protein DIC38_00045 [Candidatus Nomurabacteria bacterium]|nr:MAG: hypothetical protein O210_OD1C00001G0718 [Parcubacteria bacterium RAAC4_OD1_1]HCY26066.1 hypothetical protein [Candidatus Nomurabacteria bacterium]